MLRMIESVQNPAVKEVKKLLSHAKYRNQMQQFCIEGLRLCMDALASGVCIQSLFYTSQAKEKHRQEVEALAHRAEKSFEVTQKVFLSIADTQAPQGILCVCSMLDKCRLVDKMNKKGLFLALEHIQDPGNLGTILRSAEAFGLDGVLLSQDCCDPYSPKVLRGSMGAVFRLPLELAVEFQQVLCAFRDASLPVCAAVPDRTALSVTGFSFQQGGVMVIGNEGNGLTEETLSCCTHRVTIPMRGHAESLNASIAASILLWEMVRQG